MKLFPAIATAAVIGASFIAPNPAEARNGWMKGGCSYGECDYVKVIDASKYPYVVYMLNANQMHKMEGDCHKYRRRFIRENGSKTKWFDAMPGSVGETNMKNVCR